MIALAMAIELHAAIIEHRLDYHFAIEKRLDIGRDKP